MYRTPTRQERDRRLQERIQRTREKQFVALAEKELATEQKSKRLLIVDDTLAEDLARFFRVDGIEVIIAKTRQEGVERAIQYRPKVASLDSYLPYDSNDKETRPYGTEIAMAIRKNLPETYIIGLSSDTDSFDTRHFHAIFDKVRGIADYIKTVNEYLAK
ncbi:hypothetical protein HZA33_04070 [Candidatus Pacearchaeota archaeon]|nr:hypothetical protein [Candidatus Pacearchaeota archaeon]